MKHIAFELDGMILVLDIGDGGEWLAGTRVEYVTLYDARKEWRFAARPYRVVYPLTGERIWGWRVWR